MKSFDFHVHSKYSYDGIMSINRMIKVAKKKGLSGLAVVDHDVFSKEMLIRDLRNRDDEFIVIYGTEIKTELGDLIALNITEEVKSRSFLEAIDEIKEKDGISILPHPYRSHKLQYLTQMVNSVNWIEIWNARSSREQNNKSLELKNQKPYTVGSDAHLYRELGTSSLQFPDFDSVEEVLKRVEETHGSFEKKESPSRVHYYSSMVGTIRTGDYRTFIKGVIKKLKGRHVE